jgi:hypothetical protein
VKSYRDLMGTRMRQLCFIVGPGPSIAKAEKWLMEPKPYTFRIAINAAITKVPCEYWFWIDGQAYNLYKDHPNAKAAIKVGVENWKHLYSDDVYTWEPAKKLPEDVQNLKLLHRGTSLIGAMNFAALLGSPRIVTVGIDHKFSPEYIAAKNAECNQQEGRSDTLAQTEDYYDCVLLRVNKALHELPFWMPEWVTCRDASGGNLPLLDTSINNELDMVRKFHEKHLAKKEAVAS